MWKQYFPISSSNKDYPHEKINHCLTDLNQHLSDTEIQFFKVLVLSVKYRFTQISPLIILNQYLPILTNIC